MKTNVKIQYGGDEVDVNTIKKTVTDNMKKNKIVAKNVDDLRIYYKPAEREIYYVASSKDGASFESGDNGPIPLEQ